MIGIKNIASRRFWKSLIWGRLNQNDYKTIEVYFMFIGYQRSGHSYVGALLDAHPNTAVGMEVDALNLVQLGYNKNQLFYCLANNARIFTTILKNVWTGYSYAVPGGSQGKYEKLLAIGDKKGGKSTLRLGENPELLTRLKGLISVPVKIIHVIRNPYDNISTMALRYIEKGEVLDHKSFQKKIDLYFKKVQINNSLKNNPDYSILDVYHEELIANPEENLKKIISYIGLENRDQYLENCSKTTYKSPHKSRFELDWPEMLKVQVKKRIAKYSFLKHYTFDE